MADQSDACVWLMGVVTEKDSPKADVPVVLLDLSDNQSRRIEPKYITVQTKNVRTDSQGKFLLVAFVSDRNFEGSELLGGIARVKADETIGFVAMQYGDPIVYGKTFYNDPDWEPPDSVSAACQTGSPQKFVPDRDPASPWEVKLPAN